MAISRRPAVTGSPLSPLSQQMLGRRRLLQAGALLLAGGPVLAACGSDDEATPAASGAAASFGEITVQLSWIKNIEFAGEYFAIEKGYYTAAGFSAVELTAGPTSAESVVASGKALVGLSAPPTTAAAILKGAPLKIIGATFQKNPFCITSLTKTPIATPQDMVGKKIGVQAPNTSIFEGLLAANGIDKSTVDVVPVQFDPTVLTTGGVDGFVSYITNEPITLKAKGFDVTTFLFADHNLPLVAETFTVLQETIDKDRAKLKAFLKAEIQGWTDAVKSPEESARLAVEKYGKDQNLEVAEQTLEATAQVALIANEDTAKNGLFTMTDALIAQNIDALAKSGVTITADQIFDLTLLAEVYKENPDLIAG